MRYKNKNICKECRQYSSSCKDSKTCNPVRSKLRNYGGIRFTSDGFDCALPVSIDSHSLCSYNCLYCFADNLIEHREQSNRAIGQTRLSQIEGFFSGKSQAVDIVNMRKALKYDKLKNGYPCPVQVGAICDPCDNIERNQGWLLEYIKLAIKHNQPSRLSTKGILFLEDDYIKEISKAPHLFWVAFSIITPDDDLLKKIDKKAPTATERLKVMKKLSSIGVNTSLRFRPIIPGISDSTPQYKKAYKVLIEKAKQAGARAVSYEVAFLPGRMTNDLKKRWREIEKISGVPLRKIYSKMSKKDACMRPHYSWTENIMHLIRDCAKENEMDVGVSDPTWKQLSDYGCCCGIPPDHPVFGNWERENATNALIEAKNNKDKKIYFEDICPEWAYTQLAVRIIAYGAGPEAWANRQREYWYEYLLKSWNNLKAERSPLKYFQGAIVPVDYDEKQNIVYKYIGLKKQKKVKIPYWTV